ncbi:MAG: hypothetical protein ACEQSC_00155 [Candidatus Nanopelagicaceae bacterium]
MQVGDTVFTDRFKSLIGEPLTIVEIDGAFIICTRPSGSHALGLIADDIKVVNSHADTL